MYGQSMIFIRSIECKITEQQSIEAYSSQQECEIGSLWMKSLAIAN